MMMIRRGKEKYYTTLCNANDYSSRNGHNEFEAFIERKFDHMPQYDKIVWNYVQKVISQQVVKTIINYYMSFDTVSTILGLAILNIKL